MTKTLVLYHSPCMDGLFSAVAAHHAMPDAEYIGVSYNDELGREIFEGRNVYMLDFSVKRDELLDIARYADSVTIIDHHKSAEAELADFHSFELSNPDSRVGALEYSQETFGGGIRIAVHFDMEHSGAVLAWRHFHPNLALPELFSYVEDRDLWKFELVGTREVHEYLSLHLDPSDIPRALQYLRHFEASASERKTCIAHGSTLVQYTQKRVRELADKAFEGFFMDLPHQAMAVNAPGWIASDLGNELCQRYPNHMAVIFQIGEKGVSVSLRSLKGSDIDVSIFAAQNGGGGHKHAAGFFAEFDEDLLGRTFEEL